MPLQINLKGSTEGHESESESNNTRPSPSSRVNNVPYQYYNAPGAGATYGAHSHYQPASSPREYYMPPPPPPPPPPHPDYWYNHGHGSVAESGWKLISSPLVTKRAQSSITDSSGKSPGQYDSSPDISPLRNPTYISYDSAGPPTVTAPSLHGAPSFYPPPFYAQGPYPPYYGVPPPPDHASTAPHPHSYQWHHPPVPYQTYPPRGYQVGPYPPYPIPPYAHKPHMQPLPLAGHTRKRPLPTSYNKHVHAGYLPPRQQTHPPTSRKKKMYSDFVGVTYNLTHAKYQACITHYRKQHYLGRYKLAVDAALAYDESAKLLKGPNWKVNFPTKDAYEKARKEEIQHIGRIGDKVTDDDQSKAAEIVAAKIANLAATLSSQSKGKAVKPAGAGSSNPTAQSDEACDRKTNEKGGASVHFERPSEGTSTKKPGGKKTPFATLHATDDVEGMSKVTPCQSELEGVPLASPKLDSKLQPSQSEPDENKSGDDEEELVVKTPLPDTPDPTPHAKGVHKSTPESVIKPKVLYYQGDNEKQNATESATNLTASVDTNESDSRIEQKTPVSNPSVKSDESNITTQNATPVVKNESGTFVAASALMTLHGKEED
eukprot:CAMPEP_0201720640 /NCGR_PEP_ID=MMETSP0593-20130828/5519_1 /ASSEMBLY_ACC=CAM_ASM_000672 /TAXON_ID=267983 /ORGANISM="Skeletonema japonicum, Strain CCMP2506" /LENGTH=601 /DNA_ID=CAMNT_0048211307 /DNA_START=68 /DNA_END=1873 /DNA_ORIENTATION=+